MFKKNLIQNIQNRRFFLFFLLYFLITNATIFDGLKIIGFSSILILFSKLTQQYKLSTKISIVFIFVISPLLLSEQIKTIILPIGYQYICISLIMSFIFIETNGKFQQNIKDIELIKSISTAALCPFTYIAGPSASVEDLNHDICIEKKIPFKNLNGIEKGISGFFKIILGNYLFTFEDIFNNYLLEQNFSITKLILIGIYGFYIFWNYFLLFAGASELCEAFLYLIDIKVIENFNKPYKAIFYHEIWTKWHLNITYRVRKYLFTPLTLIALRKCSKFKPLAKFICVEGLPILVLFSVIALWHGGKPNDIIFAFISVVLTILSRGISNNKYIKNLIKKNKSFKELISLLSISLFGLVLSIYSFKFDGDIISLNSQDEKQLLLCTFLLIITYIYFKLKAKLVDNVNFKKINLEDKLYFFVFELIISSGLLIYGIVPIKTGLDFIYYGQ